MYIRFVIGFDGEDHRWLTGIITEARLLRDDGQLEQYQAIWLEETYQWLNEHLPCPPFSTSGWGREAVSWFNDNAKLPSGKCGRSSPFCRRTVSPFAFLDRGIREKSCTKTTIKS
jgi:hypothetical protein